jgi:hypothetical protein
VLVEGGVCGLVVDVDPVAACAECFVGYRADQVTADAEALEPGVHHRVEDERVGSAVPDGVREADQPVSAEGADPGQAVALEPGRPRALGGVRPPSLLRERAVMQRGELGVVDREPDPELD